MLPYVTMPYAPAASEATIFHPLVEVFSVRIHNDVDDGHIPRKISGKIRLIDEFDRSFTLYDRKSEEFETVGGSNGDGTLSLGDPRCEGDHAGGFKGMTPGSELFISVNLKDIMFGELVLGDLTTYYESPDYCYDKPCVTRFHFATIYWTTLRAAALARVSISYVGDQDSLRGVYGSLFAYYGNDFFKPDKHKYFRITLFDKPKHESVAEIKRDTLLGLTRSVLAVPAHSSIVIKGYLCDELIDIKAEFPVHTCGADNSLVLENHIKVHVQFELPF